MVNHDILRNLANYNTDGPPEALNSTCYSWKRKSHEGDKGWFLSQLTS